MGFDMEVCSNCPKQLQCSVKKGRKFYYLRFTEKNKRIAMRRLYEKTDEFKDRYRWRSGVEATMSEYDRRTGVKRLRVRGLKAVSVQF
ncbi:MAG: transposase [Proteobacteria bacterium]|nr:transposase [Pseudomonadota bacterium]